MKIINCTPHEISINGKKFPPTGKVIRVQSERKLIDKITFEEVEIPIYSVVYGELENFISPKDDEILVVSALCKEIIKECFPLFWGRIASPGMLIRDENGNVVGADGLDL